MKIYMGFSRYCGSHEGAVLIFANNAKEARKAAYSYLCVLGIAEDWIDCAVRWIKDSDHLFDQADKKLLEDNVAHVIDNPITCKNCGMWGGDFYDDGTCTTCA